jgi:chitinase
MSTYFSAGAARWDDGAQVPFLSFGAPRGPQGCSFISYEDERAILAKGAYVKAKGLGGAIIWTINQGYLAGAAQPNPLLEAFKTGFLQ